MVLVEMVWLGESFLGAWGGFRCWVLGGLRGLG